MKIKPILRWLLVPRTDSPTIAYYAGLYSGVVLTLQVQMLLKQIRENRELREALTDDELQRRADNLSKIFRDT